MSLLVYFKKELNILRVAIDVLDVFQLSDVYQVKMYAKTFKVSNSSILFWTKDMAIFALQSPKNLNASHNGVLAREGLSFELSRVMLQVDYIL